MTRCTHIRIDGEKFLINDEPTYKDVTWNGHPVEGLLLNSRMVQGIFDDQNPATRDNWAYPDTEEWDPERNTSEFIDNMARWREHGLLAFTINLQGGSPQGYSRIESQVWLNSAINSDGSLDPVYMDRLERILDHADTLGMVVILGLFYFGQERVLQDEDAILYAVDNTLDWLFEHQYRHILIEINNESNVVYKQPILQPGRVHELIQRVRNDVRDGWRYPASTSFGGGYIPDESVVRVADFLLIHGNGVDDPQIIIDMVTKTRAVPGYHPMPILFNEDDHFDFDKPLNNMTAAISQYASWGYFDYRMEGEGFKEGYQSVPVDWGINSERKRGFFNLVRHITGGLTTPDTTNLLYIVNVEGAIVHPDGRYLIVTRGAAESHAAGLMALVGGKLEGRHEQMHALENALRREIREEVNLEVGEVVYLYSSVFVANDRPVLDVIFLCRYQSGEALALTDEVESILWHTAEEIISNPAAPPWLHTQIEQAEAMRQHLRW